VEWRKNRGVERKNLALDWLRNAAAAGTLPQQKARGGVIYFGDDDNTYDIEIFDEVGMIVIFATSLPHVCYICGSLSHC